MKKRIYAMLLAAVMVFGVSACGTSDTEKKEEAVASSAILNMGTGDTEGSYYAFGNLLSAHMGDAAGVTIDVVSTEGSVENIKGIHEGLYQVGMAQADVMSYAWNGIIPFAREGEMRSFRAIGGLYEEALQIVTLGETIRSVEDLRGIPVSIGAENSGVAFTGIPSAILLPTGFPKNHAS